MYCYSNDYQFPCAMPCKMQMCTQFLIIVHNIIVVTVCIYPRTGRAWLGNYMRNLEQSLEHLQLEGDLYLNSLNARPTKVSIFDIAAMLFINHNLLWLTIYSNDGHKYHQVARSLPLVPENADMSHPGGMNFLSRMFKEGLEEDWINL